MCCLFGIYNYSGKSVKNLSHLTNCLAAEATVRGHDAAGIAYNNNGKLLIHKESKSALELTFKHPDNPVCIMGHTRHSTQGSEKKNYNNHPFFGKCKNLNFALAHNGVLTNDYALRKELRLPHTKIETDSYIAVQLIEKKKELCMESVKFMAEKVKGSFSFSLLDSDDALWLIRGDNPLTMLHLPGYELFIYASTSEILYRALIETKLFDAVKRGNTEEIEPSPGDIIKILPEGRILRDNFNYSEYINYGRFCWWDYDVSKSHNQSYIEDLKEVAKSLGFAPKDIDDMVLQGFSPEEIEDFIYCL